LSLLKAAAFHPKFFGQYVKHAEPLLIECILIVDDLRVSLEVPMMRFRDLYAKLIGKCGSEAVVMEVLSDIHEAGKIFWFGKNRPVDDHGDDMIFLEVQWLVDTICSLFDRETVQQMAAQLKINANAQVYENVELEQCQAYIDHGTMSVDILRSMWKSVLPQNQVDQETMQNVLMTLLVIFKIGYPTDTMSIHSDPTEAAPKGKFIINPDNYKAEWTGGGRAEPSYFQIPFLVDVGIPPEAEDYLKTLGLIEEGLGAKTQKFPETLGVEFNFPIFCPRGLFTRMVSHLGQVLKSVYFVSLWRDGVWARTSDHSAGLLVQQVFKDSLKTGPVPSERRALRFSMVDLSNKAGAADSVQTCNKMWTTFASILKEAETILVWYPGLYYLSYSLCPHCRNPACPSEYHDGRELAKTHSIKCKSCNKEALIHYLLKTH